MSVATLTSKGQVTLPKKIRELLHLKPGEKIEFWVDKKTGAAMIVPLNKRVDDVFGILKPKTMKPKTLKTKSRKKAVTIEEMDRAVGAKFRKEYS